MVPFRSRRIGTGISVSGREDTAPGSEVQRLLDLPPMKFYRVVDGQQRLTTASILLARIAEILGDEGNDGELTGEDIRLDLLTNPKKPEHRRRKLRLQDGDEEGYRQIIDEHWDATEKALDARRNAERIDEFLCDLMRWRTGSLVARDRTYDDFRRWAIRQGRDGPARRPELCSELACLAARG